MKKAIQIKNYLTLIDSKKGVALENAHKVTSKETLDKLQGVTFTSSKPLKRVVSQYFAIKTSVYSLYETSRYNIEFHASFINDLMSEKENGFTLSEIEKHQKEQRKAQAFYLFMRKKENANKKEVFKEVATLYPSYLARCPQTPNTLCDAIVSFFARYNVQVNDSVVTYLNSNIGLKSSNVKNSIVSNTSHLSETVFCGLFMDLLCDVFQYTGQMNDKIINGTVDSLKLFLREEDYELPMVEKKNRTINEYKALFYNLGMNPLNSASKLVDYENAYKKARRQGYFIEY